MKKYAVLRFYGRNFLPDIKLITDDKNNAVATAKILSKREKKDYSIYELIEINEL